MKEEFPLRDLTKLPNVEIKEDEKNPFDFKINIKGLKEFSFSFIWNLYSLSDFFFKNKKY
jgi:hypothetical protein